MADKDDIEYFFLKEDDFEEVAAFLKDDFFQREPTVRIFPLGWLIGISSRLLLRPYLITKFSKEIKKRVAMTKKFLYTQENFIADWLHTL